MTAVSKYVWNRFSGLISFFFTSDENMAKDAANNYQCIIVVSMYVMFC